MGWDAAGALGGQGLEFSREAPLMWLWEVKQDPRPTQLNPPVPGALSPSPVACRGCEDSPLGSREQARGLREDSTGPAEAAQTSSPSVTLTHQVPF